MLLSSLSFNMSTFEGEVSLVDIIDWKSHTLTDLLFNNIPQGWETFFSSQETLQSISESLHEETQKGVELCPDISNVFNAFYMCPFNEIKCVIVGQDPYHSPKTAYGLAFSSYPHSTPPASLRNIFKKLRQEGFSTSTGYLGKWASQGVFLINTALTVPVGCPEKHLKLWEKFIECLFLYLSQKTSIVWMLWGKKAQKFRNFIDETKNLLLEGGHPSPVNTRGDFLNKDYFHVCNMYLNTIGKSSIDWNL